MKQREIKLLENALYTIDSVQKKYKVYKAITVEPNQMITDYISARARRFDELQECKDVIEKLINDNTFTQLDLFGKEFKNETT